MNLCTRAKQFAVAVALCWTWSFPAESANAQLRPGIRTIGDFAVPGNSNRSTVYSAALFRNGLLAFAEPISGKVFVTDSRGATRCEVKPSGLASPFHGSSSLRTHGSLAAMLDLLDTRQPTARLTVFDSTCKTRATMKLPMSRWQTFAVLGVVDSAWVVQRVTRTEAGSAVMRESTTHVSEFFRVDVLRQAITPLYRWRDGVPRKIVTVGLHERTIEPLFPQPTFFGVAGEELVELAAAIPSVVFRTLSGTEKRTIRVKVDTVRITQRDRESELDAKYPRTDDPTSAMLRSVAASLPTGLYKPIARSLHVLSDGSLAIVRSGQSQNARTGLQTDSLLVDFVDGTTGRTVKRYALPSDLEVLDVDSERILAKRNTRSETKADDVHFRFGARILTFEFVK